MCFWGVGDEHYLLPFFFLFLKLHLTFNNQFDFLPPQAFLSSKLEHKHSVAFLKIIF